MSTVLCNGCALISERRSFPHLKCGGVPDTLLVVLKYLPTATACLVLIAATEKECVLCVNKCACKIPCEPYFSGFSCPRKQLCCKWDTCFFAVVTAVVSW